MSIELTPADKKQAVESIERYCAENFEDADVGNLAAAALLNFFLAEIGPVIYNQGVAAAQARMQARVAELDFEVHEDEFQYWKKPARGKGRG